MEEEVAGSLGVEVIQEVEVNPLAFALHVLNVLIHGNDVGCGLICEVTKVEVTERDELIIESLLMDLTRCICPC
jgi:hypothetical protein